MLDTIRKFIDQYAELEKHVGSIFQLRLVIDTNAVISDLLWMARRRNEENYPAIIEVIRAGTLITYAPDHLKDEVEEHWPNIAEKNNIPKNKTIELWLEYQEYLEFIEVDKEDLKGYEDSVDPEDAPFVVLSKMMDVHGVISDDPHIDQLGGKRINMDIRLSLRDYSRTAAVVYSLRLGGLALSIASTGLLIAMVKGAVKLMRLIGSLPDRFKVILLVALILVILIPTTRNKLLEYMQSAKVFIGEQLGGLGSDIEDLLIEASEEGKKIEMKLEEIESYLV